MISNFLWFIVIFLACWKALEIGFWCGNKIKKELLKEEKNE